MNNARTVCRRCRLIYEPILAKYKLVNKKMEEQIDGLADFIMKDVEGEPSQNQGAIETAIRIIKELQQKNNKLQCELEQERVRLAGCLVIAEGHIDDTVKQGVYGWSLPYERIKELQQENAKLKERLNIHRLKVNFGYLVDKHFPKGECKERGMAIVLFAKLIIEIAKGKE